MRRPFSRAVWPVISDTAERGDADGLGQQRLQRRIGRALVRRRPHPRQHHLAAIGQFAEAVDAIAAALGRQAHLNHDMAIAGADEAVIAQNTFG